MPTFRAVRSRTTRPNVSPYDRYILAESTDLRWTVLKLCRQSHNTQDSPVNSFSMNYWEAYYAEAVTRVLGNGWSYHGSFSIDGDMDFTNSMRSIAIQHRNRGFRYARVADIIGA